MPPTQPTAEQLANRLNPTPTTIYTPQEGLFRARGDYGTTIYKTNADGTLTTFNLLDYNKANNLGGMNAGQQADRALRDIQSKYGFSYDALPEVNMADLFSSWRGQAGKGYDTPDGWAISPNMMKSSTNIMDFVQGKTSNLTASTINNIDPNAPGNHLATPTEIATQMQNPNWIGANTDPNRVINQTTGQTGAQMNAYNTILQSLQSGKPVTAEQYQAAGITDVVKFQAPSGYTSLVPKSMADQLSQQMPGSKVIDSAYTVVKGDTLSAIAKKNGMSLQQLLTLNPQFSTGGRNPDLIYPGDKVNLGTTSGTGGATGGTGTTGGTGGSLSGLVNNNTTTSNALGSSASYSSVLGTLSSANSDRQKIQEAILALLKPSDRETELQKQLKDLQNRYLQAQVGTESQAIPLGLIGGQLDALKQDVAYRQMPLTSELESLQQSRESGLKSAQALYGFANDNEQQQMAMQKLQYEMSQPDTQVITETDKNGNVTAVVIDKRTGKVISQSNLGGIGKGFAPTSSSGGLSSGNPVVDSWVSLISRGAATIANVPADLRTSVVNALATGGTTVLSQKQRDTLNSVTSAQTILDSLQQKLAGMTMATNAGERLTVGLPLYLSGVFQTDKDATLFNSYKEGILSQLSRATGERGVLTDQDIARVRTLLPGLTDTQAVASGKIEQLKNYFNELNSRTYSSFTEPAGNLTTQNNTWSSSLSNINLKW